MEKESRKWSVYVQNPEMPERTRMYLVPDEMAPLEKSKVQFIFDRIKAAVPTGTKTHRETTDLCKICASSERTTLLSSSKNWQIDRSKERVVDRVFVQFGRRQFYEVEFNLFKDFFHSFFFRIYGIAVIQPA